MKSKKETKQSKIAQVLGASRITHIKKRRNRSPLGWLALSKEVQDNLKSTGGRPTISERDIKRLIPFQGIVWHQLSKRANTFSRKGNKVSPAQLAALLIEKGIEEINNSSLKKEV